MKKIFGLAVSLAVLIIMSYAAISAETSPVKVTGLPELKNSQAFMKYVRGPKTEYAKLLFLIERFATTDIQINYDGIVYGAPFAATIARQFVRLNYRRQTARDWVMQYGNRTLIGNNLVWARFPGKPYRLTRDILNDELNALEKANVIERKDK